MDEKELLKKLREAFKIESDERLANLSRGLLELEKVSSAKMQFLHSSSESEIKPVLESIFREAHSLKGAARAVNLTDIEGLCQSIENIFSELKRDKIGLSSELFDILHDSLQAMENVLSSPEAESGSGHKEEISHLIHKIESLKLTDNTEAEPAESSDFNNYPFQEDEEEPPDTDISEDVADIKPSSVQHPVLEGEYAECLPVSESEETVSRFPNLSLFNKPLISETVRISVSKLDILLLEAEEFASLKLVSSQRLHNLKEIFSGFEIWKREWNKAESEYRILRTQAQKQGDLHGKKKEERIFSALSGILDFTEWNHEQIQTIGRSVRAMIKAAEQEHRTLSRMADELLDDMKKVMMLPFSTLFDIFPRMSRDLSKCQGKEAELILQGGDIEIDRRILEDMKDPLVHLLRNAIDHGLEEPEERIKLNKPRHGTIRLSVSQPESSKIEVIFSDDGKGVDFARVKEEAVKTKLISEEDADNLKYQDVISFIFRSGFSSSRIITEISGRGLGLAIVQERVERLGGFLSVDTEPGKGTSFRIQLPVTLATFRGVLIRTADQLFILPSLYMERLLRIRENEIKTVENRATILFNDQVIPLSDLAHILNIEEHKSRTKEGDKNKCITVMVLGTGQKQVAFKIDEVICEQEVLVKSLGKQLARVANIAGATILGSGKVVPILNVHDLIKTPSAESFKFFSDKEKPEINDGDKSAGGSKGNILVVEDSITSRILIKNILEASGYIVKTAVDGRDGLSLLKTESFDVVVSDVEMPRMNGFELTEKIRNDTKLGELPVILVTSLDSREDRERGIDVGADAYIVKSSFDQSNLLDVIARMI